MITRFVKDFDSGTTITDFHIDANCLLASVYQYKDGATYLRLYKNDLNEEYAMMALEELLTEYKKIVEQYKIIKGEK